MLFLPYKLYFNLLVIIARQSFCLLFVCFSHEKATVLRYVLNESAPT